MLQLVKSEHSDRPVVGTPRSFGELCDAFGLVYSEYAKHEYIRSHSSEMRYGVSQLLNSSQTFVATVGARVIGTGTVVFDSAAGLPSTEVFGDVIADLRDSGRRVVEATMLACVPTPGTAANVTSTLLIPWAFAWAIDQGADDFCVVVNAKHLSFWRDLLGFEVLGAPRSCGHVRGAMGYFLRFDLTRLSSPETLTKGFKRIVLSQMVNEALLAGEYELTDVDAEYLLDLRPELLDDCTPEGLALLKSERPGLFDGGDYSYHHPLQYAA